MAEHWADPRWRTRPREDFVCSLEVGAEKAPKIPLLLSAYLALGAEICGPPAIDRKFGSIDFLTMVDLRSPAIMAVQLRGRFGGGSVSG
jgi:putative hemolysin